MEQMSYCLSQRRPCDVRCLLNSELIRASGTCQNYTNALKYTYGVHVEKEIKIKTEF